MITHDKAKSLVDCYNIETAEHLLHKYITQQEKKDELLGLYRHVYFHDKMMSEEEFYQTLYKIKALEEEIK